MELFNRLLLFSIYLFLFNYLSQKYKESGNTTPYISVYYTYIMSKRNSV